MSSNESTDLDSIAASDGFDTDETDPRRVSNPEVTTTNRGTGVYNPYRKVTVRLANGTDIPFDGVDVDISFTHRKTGTPEWTVATTGLSANLWARLRRGLDVKIHVGWRDGPQRTLAYGPIQVMRARPRSGETEYIMRGTSHAAARLGKRVSRTWMDVAPHTIARKIASIANVNVGRINTDAERFESRWTITKNRPLSQWLDELVRDAERLTGRAWVWYVHADELFFVPRGTPTGSEITIPHTQTTGEFPSVVGDTPPVDPDAFNRRFNRRIDPAVRRGRAVRVRPDGSDDATTTYTIGAYHFETSTRTGRHFMHGTLVPAHGTYRPDWAWDESGGRGIDVDPENIDHR